MRIMRAMKTEVILSRLLNQLRSQLDGFDSFDHLSKRGKMSRGGGKSGKFRAPSRSVAAPKAMQKRMSLGGGASIEAAIFDIVVSRDTAAIAGTALPFALFGSQHIDSQYNGIITAVNGATLTVKNGIIGAAGNTTKFSYLVGGDTDVITIECTSGSTYPAFLRALDSGRFRINKIRMQLSDSAQLTQFSQEFSYFDYSMFGKESKNKLSVSSFKDPNQFQSGIVDIPFSGEIDNESGFTSALIAVAGFSVTYSVFVEKIA
jgi:hypothetical protein